MKKIWHIACNELFRLFYSPIAWIMMIVFLVLSGMSYITQTETFWQYYRSGGWSLMLLQKITSGLTIGNEFSQGYLLTIMKDFYIYLPLITMGLISMEFSNGTIRLLYSSPVKIRQLVLGKYLGMVLFLASLMIMLLPAFISVSLTVVDVDYSQLLASTFALFVILCTYAAIGLFISSLTSYQVAAAIITFGVFLFLARIGDMWQDVAVVRHITFYLKFEDKALNFIKGLINTRDLFYFMIIISCFLLFTIIKLKSTMELPGAGKKIMRYVAVISAAFILAYITSRPGMILYADATRDKVFTITPRTQKLLATLDGDELEIVAYGNLFEGYGLFEERAQNTVRAYLWEPYIRFKPDIRLEYRDFYYADTTTTSLFAKNPGKTLKELAEHEATAQRYDFTEFLTPEQVMEEVDEPEELKSSFFLLKYKGKKTVLRVYRDKQYFPSENEVAAAINRLIAKPPKLVFLTDELERSPFLRRARDYKGLTSARTQRLSLINQGYDVDTLSLRRVDSIPADIAALVIADPRTPFSAENLEKINRYINAGGNIYLSGEPDRAHITKPLMDKFGITIRPGILIQPSEKMAADMVYAALTDTAKNLSPQYARHINDYTRYGKDSVFLIGMSGASTMDCAPEYGFEVDPLLATQSDKSWNRIAPIIKDSLQMKVDRSPDDEQGTFFTAFRLNRKINGKEQRVIVASDADYLTVLNSWDGATTVENFNFGFWCFSYFSYGQFPTNTIRPASTDNSFKLLATGSISKMKLIFYWAVPGIIGIIATMILARRKRK